LISSSRGSAFCIQQPKSHNKHATFARYLLTAGSVVGWALPLCEFQRLKENTLHLSQAPLACALVASAIGLTSLPHKGLRRL
jgi:hypothetical protein